MNAPIEHNLPDPHTYHISINDRQWKMLFRAMELLVAEELEGGDPQYDENDFEVMESLKDMLDPDGSTGGLAPSPCLNGFVL